MTSDFSTFSDRIVILIIANTFFLRAGNQVLYNTINELIKNGCYVILLTLLDNAIPNICSCLNLAIT